MHRRTFLGSFAAAQRPLTGPVIDAHNHLNHRSRATWKQDDRKLIDAADKLGIEKLCCSILPPERPISLEGFRQSNEFLREAIQRFPGRVLGYCVVNPGHGREALAEIRLRVEEHGFIGIKLYNDYRADEPTVGPIVELAIELKVPILHHAGHATWLPSPQPRISDASHIVALAKRYPEAMLICAHICGGGDWEWSIKALRGAPSVYLDTSGSVPDEGVVERAVALLGAGRLLFACDLSMTASVGRLRGAEISEADRRGILGGNMQRLLDARRRG